MWRPGAHKRKLRASYPSPVNRRAIPVIVGRLSYLAVLPAMYVVAAVVCFSQLGGLRIRPSRWLETAVYAFCTAAAVYLFDRVKLAPRFLDPADRAAHPARYAFIEASQTSIR